MKNLVRVYKILLSVISVVFVIFLVGTKYDLFQNGIIYVFLYLLFPLVVLLYFVCSFLFAIKNKRNDILEITIYFVVGVLVVFLAGRLIN